MQSENITIKRVLFDEVVRWLDSNKIIIIKGARQVGKTTLLLLLKKYLEEKGNRTAYLSADDLMFKDIFQTPERFFQYLKFEHQVQKDAFVFIDEFQYIKDAGLFMKVLYDRVKRESLNLTFIISGSSSLEISKNKEFLTGRKVEFMLSPLGLHEILPQAKKAFDVTFDIHTEFNDIIDFYNIYRHELEGEFMRYLRWGGYPEVYLTDDVYKKAVIFKEIITTYLEKDIAGFLRVENIQAFNNLIKLLAGQIGNLVNKNELSNSLGISYKTSSHYLDLLKGTYIFTTIPPYFTNTRKELTQMPKVFVHDPGLYYYYYGSDISFNTIEGKVIENFVFNTLQHRYSGDIYFYRTKGGAEVDFVVREQGRMIPVEVKFRKKITMPAPLKRFMADYHSEHALVLTKESIKKEENVFYIPILMLPFCKLKTG
ncbi:MAG: ATP-binding protein, partial [bacterium]|nr:ATP-binding protein [bacterium]